MRKAILASMFLALALVAYGQHGKTQIGGGKAANKSKAKPKPTPAPNLKGVDKPWYSPCGVYYKNIADFVDSLEDKWQLIARTETAEDEFYYNGGKSEICGDDGVLKVWIKMVETKTKKYSMIRYELKCKSDLMRFIYVTNYDDNGRVLNSDSFDDSPWKEAVPDSAGEEILKTVCRRPS
jgi:hypothetical protein